MSNNLSVGNNYKFPNQQPTFTADGKPISATNNAVVQNNPLLNAATSTNQNPAVLVGGTIGSAAGLMWLNDKINNPLLNNDYNNTFFKKIEVFVDKYASKPFVQNTRTVLRNANAWFKKNIVRKSEILRTLWQKNSIGRNFAQSQAAGTNGHLANRALEIMKNYQKATGFTGFDNIIAKAEKESFKYYDEIINTIKTSGADLNKVLAQKPWWGFGIIKNKSSLKEILNKDILIKNYKAGGKTLGQKFAGYLMRGAECITNGLFSGKGPVLLQALFVAQSISEATKAEKGEKFSTFMASWAELMSFLATAALQVRVTNKLAALKFIGMSPTDVKKLQEAVELGNIAAKAGNTAEYYRHASVINNLKTAAKHNTKWYQKPIKWVGDIIGWARPKEMLMPLNKGTMFSKIARGLAKFKTGIGFVGRMAFVMAVVIPIFSGIAKRLSYAIFGKPVKTIEREKAKELAESQQAENKQAQQLDEVLKPQSNQQTPTGKPGSLLEEMQEKYNNKTNTTQPVVANQPIATTPVTKTAEQNAGIKRSYIPNPILGVENIVQPSATRNAAIDAVLRQADWAEAQAQKYL